MGQPLKRHSQDHTRGLMIMEFATGMIIGWIIAEIIRHRPMIKVRVKRNKIDN
jgi:hypothetical protein